MKTDPRWWNVPNWANHLPLLLLALEDTRDSPHPILELGGHADSAPLVRDYCRDEGRGAVVIEEDLLACFRLRADLEDARTEIRCAAFDEADFERHLWSVAVVAHSPGERRYRDVLRLANAAEIVVIRDTEPAADHGYQFSRVWPSFRSRVDVKTEGAWSSAVSNSRDLSKWRGLRLGEYLVSGSDDDVKADPVNETIYRALYPDLETT